MKSYVGFGLLTTSAALTALSSCNYVLGNDEYRLYQPEGGASATSTTGDTSGSAGMGGAASASAGGGCPAPQSDCSGSCTDTSTDENNCGVCSHACPQGASCISGLCSCPVGKTLCSDTCADLSSDDKNCGSCGHGCEGGPCQASTCEFVILLSPLLEPFNICTDANRVYWRDSGSAAIYAMSLAGGPVTEVVTAPKWSGQEFAVDGANVYWVTPNGVVMKISINGGIPFEVHQPYASISGSTGISLDADTVYWAYQGSAANGYSDGSIVRTAKNGSSAAPVVTAHKPALVGNNSKYVYWLADNKIMAWPKSGGGELTIASLQSSYGIVTVVESSVYWYDSGSIYSALADGAGGPKLVVAQVTAIALAADSHAIYWTNPVGNFLESVLVDGSGFTSRPMPGDGWPLGLSKSAIYVGVNGTPGNFFVDGKLVKYAK